MKIKDGAILAGLDIKMRPALIVADSLWKELNQELVVTEGLGGTHSAGSLHYYGLAIDLRTHYFPKDRHKDVAEELRQRLLAISIRFQVILHSTHIHVEYDDPHVTKWWVH